MEKITVIVDSWLTALNPTKLEKEIAKERMKVCSGCEHKTKHNILRIVVCDLCDCPLKAKKYSKESTCPLKKWTR